jgi:hypothetical protein
MGGLALSVDSAPNPLHSCGRLAVRLSTFSTFDTFKRCKYRSVQNIEWTLSLQNTHVFKLPNQGFPLVFTVIAQPLE